MTLTIEAIGLSKRYGPIRALRDCSFAVPSGRIVGLVGPNGSGKTTLLHIAVGLLDADAGQILVRGRSPRRDLPELLERIGFVAQDRPLYRGFTVGETVELGRRLNRQWDDEVARGRLLQLGVAMDRKVGRLSKGQQAQVALSLALAKRPEVLLLDEPLAGLDPLARRGFLQELLASTAESGTTIMLTSHVLAEVERVCDQLVVLADGRVEVAGDIERLLRDHAVVNGPRSAEHTIAATVVVSIERAERQFSALVRTASAGGSRWPALNGFEVRSPSLEELVLAYLERSTRGEAEAAAK